MPACQAVPLAEKVVTIGFATLSARRIRPFLLVRNSLPWSQLGVA